MALARTLPTVIIMYLEREKKHDYAIIFSCITGIQLNAPKCMLS